MAPPRAASPAVITAVTLLLLAILVLFMWRVYGYYRQIRSGVPVLPQFSSRFTADGKTSNAASGAVDVAATDAPALGPKDAKLTVVEFIDFECPYSAQESDVVRTLAEQYKDRMRLVIRQFPLVDIHPDALYAAEAALCADAQGKFWQMHDRLFMLKGQLKAPDLENAAERSGLDMDAYRDCMKNQAPLKAIQKDVDDGNAAGIRGTPTFFFNGRRVEGAIPQGVFEQLIKTVSGT